LGLLISSATICAAQKADGYYLNAVNFVNASNFPQAMGEVQKALDLDPAHAQSIYLRAFINLKTGNKEAALKDYTQLLKIAPGHEGALNNRSLIYMEQGKYQLALADLDARLAIEDTWNTRFDRAYCLALMDLHKEAAEEFTKVLKEKPDYAPALANRGYSIINLETSSGLTPAKPGSLKSACTDLKQALALGDTTVVRSIKKYCTEK
jgi:tetratricopeptide (TPR) repeat protein